MQNTTAVRFTTDVTFIAHPKTGSPSSPLQGRTYDNKQLQVGYSGNAGALLVLVLWVFVQWGFTTLLSVQFFGVIMVSIVFARERAFRAISLPIFLVVGAFAVIEVGNLDYVELLPDAIFRAAREACCALLILTGARFIPQERTISPIFLARATIAIQLILLFAVIFQEIFYYGAGNTALFPSQDLFTVPSGISASYWANFAQARGIDVDIRPAATFSEPSYLAFITLMLLAVSLASSRGRLRFFSISLALLTLVLSRSLSGVILTGIFLLSLSGDRFMRIVLRRPVTTFLVVVIGFLAFAIYVLPRIDSQFFENRLESATYRFSLPLAAAQSALESHPTGVSPVDLPALLSPLMSSTSLVSIDNATIGLFVYFGFLAPLVLYLLYKAVPGTHSVLLVFLVMQFNGDIFSLDKAFVLGSAFFIAKSAQGLR